MSIFGIVSEGVTDQITIENILCGYFKNTDLDDEIEFVEPPFDKSTRKASDFSNWTTLLNYLKMKRFRDDVVSYNFIIIQIDTDISKEKFFDVSHFDKNNQELEPYILIEKVIEKLVSIINSGDNGFYQYNAEKIIFAISVHQLECWLYAYYNNKPRSQPKIKGCFEALSRLPCFDKTVIEKNYDCYNELSKPFLKRKNIETVAQKDPSFHSFIQQLKQIVVNN